jgi:hypothetical protein
MSWINWSRNSTKELCKNCRSDYLSISGQQKFCRTCGFNKKEIGI